MHLHVFTAILHLSASSSSSNTRRLFYLKKWSECCTYDCAKKYNELDARNAYLFINLDMRSIILLLNVLQIFFFFLFYSQLFLAKLVILLRNSTVSPPLLRVFLGLTEQSSSSFFLFLISLNFSVTLSLTSSALALSDSALSDSAFFFVFSFPFSCSSSEDFHCLINFGFFNFNA